MTQKRSKRSKVNKKDRSKVILIFIKVRRNTENALRILAERSRKTPNRPWAYRYTVMGSLTNL